MKTKKTSFAVTESALQFENVLIKEMDIPRTTFHRRMIDYFLENEIEVHPYLLIKKNSDSNFVKREAMEQIYLDEVRALKLEEVAERYKCRIGVLLFQALISYSVAIAPEVLGKKDMERLFPGEK